MYAWLRRKGSERNGSKSWRPWGAHRTWARVLFPTWQLVMAHLSRKWLRTKITCTCKNGWELLASSRQNVFVSSIQLPSSHASFPSFCLWQAFVSYNGVLHVLDAVSSSKIWCSTIENTRRKARPFATQTCTQEDPQTRAGRVSWITHLQSHHDLVERIHRLHSKTGEDFLLCSLVPLTCNSQISYKSQGVERNDGRLSKKDFGELVKKLGMETLTSSNGT